MVVSFLIPPSLLTADGVLSHQVAAFTSRALVRGPHRVIETQLLPLLIPNVSENILKFHGGLSLIPLFVGMSQSSRTS